MDELTGPIIAITLVLSSVFLPSCFIPGLTGQFYRQFALTIAASVIISADQRHDADPSRAVSIFKDRKPGATDTSAARGPPLVDHRCLGGCSPCWLVPTGSPTARPRR